MFVSADYKVGRCPKLDTTWNHTYEGHALNHTKLLGVWQTVKMNEQDDMWLECHSMKLAQIGDDPTRLQVLVGGVTQPQPELEIVYESYKQWVFKHPQDTSLAYETGIADDGVNTPDTYLTEFEKTLLKKLTKK